MKRNVLLSFAVLGLAVSLTSCAKKADDQANLASINGFDSLATSEELAQLPQASNTNQQQGVEVLPIEASPVSQAPGQTIALPSAATVAASVTGLSREQQIQTALKAAGFYNGSIDGKIGPASKRAIEAFQKSNGLKVDGKVGPKTWTALEAYLNGTAVAPTAGESTQQ